MKKYSNDISKLYENIGYEKIESGNTYTTSKGDKITINSIFIDAIDEIPSVKVEYDIETATGEKETETNRFGLVVDIIIAQ